jgi:C4-type Zn-finger protein
MQCPKCGKAMEYSEGEDETLDGDLVMRASYFCNVCGIFVNDWEDEFEYPEDK